MAWGESRGVWIVAVSTWGGAIAPRSLLGEIVVVVIFAVVEQK